MPECLCRFSLCVNVVFLFLRWKIYNAVSVYLDVDVDICYKNVDRVNKYDFVYI